jgi:hypothetical protein
VKIKIWAVQPNLLYRREYERFKSNKPACRGSIEFAEGG